MKIDLDNHELNLTAVQFNFARMMGDTASLTIGLDIPAGWTESNPIEPAFPDGFEHLDYVEFWKDGGKLMAGYVTEIKPTPCGKAWDVQYTISSVLAMLESIPYVPPSDEERLVLTYDAVAHVLAHAKAYSGIDFNYTIGSLSADKVPSITSSMTCGEALQSLLDWCPNVRVAMSYSDTADTIVVGGTAPDCSYSLVSGLLLDGSGEQLATSKGAESVDISARYDLQHPCVTVLHGTSSASYGDASKKYAPYSIVYDLPYSAIATEEAADEALGSNAVQSMRQREIVRGTLIPKEHDYETNHMLSIGTSAQLAFWQAVDSPWQLRKAGDSSNLIWGGFHVDPLEGSEAYPQDDSTDPDEPSKVPYNYESCANWSNIYLHTSGTFMAHTESKYCTSGLKFCRASCEQNIYCKDSDEIAGLTMEQRNEWLTGEFTKNGIRYRYTTVKCEGIFINRAIKSYYPLTGELDSSDSDYQEPEDEEEEDSGGSASTGVSWSDVRLGAEQYYDATRKLYYDGSLSLVRFVGNPTSLISSTLSVLGGLGVWESMASPITSVSYNPLADTLSLSVGVSEILSINEYADRMATTRRLLYGSIAESLSSTPAEDGDSGATEPEEEEVEDADNGVASIAAGYTCNYSMTTNAVRRRPWEVYPEGDTWYIEGGLLPSPQGLIDVERQEIADYSNTKRYAVRLALTTSGYEGRVVVVSSS